MESTQGILKWRNGLRKRDALEECQNSVNTMRCDERNNCEYVKVQLKLRTNLFLKLIVFCLLEILKFLN